MARKATSKIEQEMYDALEHFFDGKISGAFYPSDCRPADSEVEDVVLTVSNATAEQIQDGIARINIYVPDLDNGSGRPVPDKDRLAVLSDLDEQIIDVLNEADTDFEFDLSKGTETINAEAIKQHFVNITIEFKYITFN
ncbi:hypothetical protein [Phocaeicola faecalis]